MVLCGVAAFLAGCATTPHPSEPITLEAKGEAFLEDAAHSVSSSRQNQWEMLIEATGKGLAAPHAPTDIQKELTALEAAKYRAMAELAEKMRGMHVSRQGKVRDMAFASEEIAVELSSEIEGAHIVKETYDKKTGIAEVTVRIGMDKDGNMISQSVPRLSPLSLPERMARAEEAARIRAVAALREQVGRVRIEEEIEVRNLVLVHQHARQQVEGIMEQVRFSKPEWVSRTQCEVMARVVLSPEDLTRLASLSGGERP